MAAADFAGRRSTSGNAQGHNDAVNLHTCHPASLAQVYTAGLRWETEPMVKAVAPLKDAASTMVLHRLPRECPLDEPPGEHRSLWTALWQTACLLRPEISPAQWRPRVRRLARTAAALISAGDVHAATPDQRNVTRAQRAALDERMAEWSHRLLPSSRVPAEGLFRPEVSILESPALELDAVEACRREGGVTLVAWCFRTPIGSRAKHGHQLARPGADWQWRTVAGLEGFEGRSDRGNWAKSESAIQPRSVLLLPQNAEAAWGCGYGMRLDPVVPLNTTSPEPSGHWQLRSLYGEWASVEVVRVLMLRPYPI